jgi:hypothetical protein
MTKLNALKTLAIATLSAPLFLVSEPASAGINGQQVSVGATPNFSCQSGSVTINGYNQNNEYKTQTFTIGCDGVARTNGWWWKGWIKISFQKSPNTCYTNVPVNQGLFNNWYYVKCY